MASSFSAFVYNTLKAPSIDGVTGVLDINTGKAVASAATINLNTATGNRVHITGTTAITAVTLTRGPRTVIFDGILTLTHNATTNNLPGAANIITAAGDRAIYESDGSTVYCVSYNKVSGAAVVGTTSFTLGTPVATTSGTTVDYTGIPSNVKIIIVSFAGVSTNGLGRIGVVLGDNAGFDTAGYVSYGTGLYPSANTTAGMTNGFYGLPAINAGAALSGSMILTLMNSTTNKWVATGNIRYSDGSFSDAAVMFINGEKALSQMLTKIRLTGSGSTFDAGEVNIMYM